MTTGSRPSGGRRTPAAPASAPLNAATDLASRWLGASVLAASDESFGEKENLLNPGPAVFEPGHFGHRGEIVDGWETKRRREPGHDWALIRLGAPGTIATIDVDTSYFTGNFPELCSVEAAGVEGYPSPAELSDPAAEWAQIVPQSTLQGDAHNTFTVKDTRRFTHVRLSTFPDGGVARLRAWGSVVPDPRQFDGLTVDLASQRHGGVVVASSDAFYTSAATLNRPDAARTMGEGWETRRRRDAGNDFALLRLAVASRVRQLIVDTAHFKYNASAEVAVYGSNQEQAPALTSRSWVPLLTRTRLQPDTRHLFTVANHDPVLWVRLDAFPDGGLSRVRVIGSVDPAARRGAGFRWFNSLPREQAMRCLVGEGLMPEIAAGVIDGRPLGEEWLGHFSDRGEAPPSRAPGVKEPLSRLAEILEGAPGGS